MLTVLILLWTIFIIHLVYGLTSGDSGGDQTKQPFSQAIVDFTCRVLKIFIDVYMLITFLDLLRFFIRRKVNQLEEREQTFSLFNKFIIAWSMTLVILNFLHSFCNILYNSLFRYHSSLSDTDGYYFFCIFFSQFFVPLVDFLTATTLLYLFYF
jgi:hypothetical protein